MQYLIVIKNDGFNWIIMRVKCEGEYVSQPATQSFSQSASQPASQSVSQSVTLRNQSIKEKLKRLVHL